MAVQPLIDLWLCPLNQLDECLNKTSQLRTWLSGDEVKKVDRFRFHHDKIQALYIRCYLRCVLSQYSSLGPQEWQFHLGPKGKPALISEQYLNTGLSFNISHSKDHLLIAVCQMKNASIFLGVDIEHSRSGMDIGAVMNRYFTAEEIKDLNDLDSDRKNERFFDLWALKESYIKATGLGLSIPLNRFSFDFSSALKCDLSIDAVTMGTKPNNECDKLCIETYRGIHVNFDVSSENDTSNQSFEQIQWQTCLGRLDEQYRFAVTVGGVIPDMEIKMKHFDSSILGSLC
ncbi:4'-phosphopantetheinyl transferase superfamily protein [Vibrio sp. YMD68]|uniref:4'-phosphopantetheinyl transferase family protein n=1 Tax=Vibrio sp. YMD68 TaxID=3042300 RepID=UPI00249A2AE1|nr:4'-phosphopantetheinyl transferase superfamily protein [Vibrio sp. YMD68]WGV98983.1 4'-phosphopantetheinyl transferase superfamily protein [Vibrio sp. YMD68]